MRPDQKNPGSVTLEGSRSFAFSFLLCSPAGEHGHTLTIVQNQRNKEAALAAGTRLAEASLPGYTVADWVCCELLPAAPATPATRGEGSL